MRAIVYKDDNLYKKGSWVLLKEDGCAVNPFVTPTGRHISGFSTQEQANREATDMGLTIVDQL